MKYRIVEFKKSEKGSHDRFFVEIGQRFWVRKFWFIYIPEIKWKRDVDDSEIPIGHTTFDEAAMRISQIKEELPIYHSIL